MKNSYFLPNPSDISFEYLDNSKRKMKNDLFFAMSHGVHRGKLKKGKYDDREKILEELEKKLDNKKIEYAESRDSKKDLRLYIIKGSLIDTRNAFSYKQIESNVDFFDGNFLSSKIFIDALNSTNLDEIASILYTFLVDFYSEPSSESTIYSYQTFEWKKGEIETFLSIDKESNTIILSEVNSALEESRRFKEFKDKYIDQYQTYEEEIRYGKNRRR